MVHVTAQHVTEGTIGTMFRAAFVKFQCLARQVKTRPDESSGTATKVLLCGHHQLQHGTWIAQVTHFVNPKHVTKSLK